MWTQFQAAFPYEGILLGILLCRLEQVFSAVFFSHSLAFSVFILFICDANLCGGAILERTGMHSIDQFSFVALSLSIKFHLATTDIGSKADQRN
jgi:hypothetical protein